MRLLIDSTIVAAIMFMLVSAAVTEISADGGVGSYPTAQLLYNVSPTGNGMDTMSTFNVQGITNASRTREFLVSLGLSSYTGSSVGQNHGDKVALYVATDAHNGTGDVWAINPLLTQEPNSGNYNAQGIELDFNNNNAHRGDVDGGDGLAPPVSYGLSVTGAGGFRSTSAILVCGRQQMWNRGITFASNAIVQSSFQDLGNPNKSIDIRGDPTWGIYQSSKSSKNFFAGGTSVATDETNGFQFRVGGSIAAESRWTEADGQSFINPRTAKLKNTIGLLRSLQPKMWDIQDWITGKNKSTTKHMNAGLGLIAQDVERDAPSLAVHIVKTDDNGRKLLNYERLSTILVAALTETHDRALAEIRERKLLEKRLSMLEKQVEMLTKHLVSK